MNAVIRAIQSTVIVAVVTACATPYQQFYRAYIDASKTPGLVTLQSGAQPRVFISNDMPRDVKIARARGFVPIGESSFIGQLANEDSAIQQAQNVGAVMVLVNAHFKDTQRVTTPLFLPTSTTTNTSGSVYGTQGSASFSGSSTTSGTTVVPITQVQDRYEQRAVFFARLARPPRVGIGPADLTPELRAKLQRNTGVLVDFVFEGSAAFVANLLPGDVIIEANGTTLIDRTHGSEVIGKIGPEAQKLALKIIRDGTERALEIDVPAAR